MDPAPNITFAEWLERFLKNERLSARAFADKIDVHESMVSKLRNKVTPSRDIIDRIVAKFGVDPLDIPRHNEPIRPDNAEGVDPDSDPGRTSGRHAAPHAVFNSVPDHVVLNWGIQKGLFGALGLDPADATRHQFRYPEDVLKLVTDEKEKLLFVVPVSEEFTKLPTVQFFFLSNRYKGYALIARADAMIPEVRFGSDALARFRDLFNRIINTDALWQVAILNEAAAEFYRLVVEFFYDLQGLPWPKDGFAENLQGLPICSDNEDLIKRLRGIGSARSDFIMGHAFTAARARVTDDPKGVVMKEVLDWDSMIAVIDGLKDDDELRARFKAAAAAEKGKSPREKDQAVAERIRQMEVDWRKRFMALKLPVVWGITNAALDHMFAGQKGKYADKTELLRALSKAASDTVAELKRNPRGVEEVTEMLVTRQYGYNEQRVFWRSLKEQLQKVWHKSYEYLDADGQEEYLEELLKAEEGPYVPYRALFKQLKELLPPR